MSEFIDRLKESSNKCLNKNLDGVIMYSPALLPMVVMHSKELITTEEAKELEQYIRKLILGDD